MPLYLMCLLTRNCCVLHASCFAPVLIPNTESDIGKWILYVGHMSDITGILSSYESVYDRLMYLIYRLYDTVIIHK